MSVMWAKSVLARLRDEQVEAPQSFKLHGCRTIVHSVCGQVLFRLSQSAQVWQMFVQSSPTMAASPCEACAAVEGTRLRMGKLRPRCEQEGGG